MPVSPFISVEDAQAALVRLRSDASIPSDELVEIREAAVTALARILAICQSAQQSIRQRKSRLRSFLNIGAWVFGVGGYVCGLGDYFFFELSPWGWSGLLLGTGGLFVAAWLWQLDEWDTQDDEFEEAQAEDWEKVLCAIRDEVNRRADRDKPLPAISHEQNLPGLNISGLPTPTAIRDPTES